MPAGTVAVSYPSGLGRVSDLVSAHQAVDQGSVESWVFTCPKNGTGLSF